MFHRPALHTVTFGLLVVVLSATASYFAARHAVRACQREFVIGFVQAFTSPEGDERFMKNLGVTPDDFGPGFKKYIDDLYSEKN